MYSFAEDHLEQKYSSQGQMSVQRRKFAIAVFIVLLVCGSTGYAAGQTEGGASHSTQNTAPTPAVVQQPAGASATAPLAYDKQPVPADPAAALMLANKANGLGGEGLKPWHLKGHYQAYDAKGKPAYRGTFEIYWQAGDHYRVSYTGSQFDQSEYITPDGFFFAGTPDNLPYPVSIIFDEVMHPLEVLARTTPRKLQNKNAGSTALSCMEFARPNQYLTDNACLDNQLAMLRTRSIDKVGAIFNRVAVFQHHFVSNQISIIDQGAPVIDIFVDDLRSFQPGDETALVVPVDAHTQQ